MNLYETFLPAKTKKYLQFVIS